MKKLISDGFLWWDGDTMEKAAERLQIVNNRTLTTWWRRCQEVTIEMCIALSEPICVDGAIVEIDESKFGKRKYLFCHIGSSIRLPKLCFCLIRKVQPWQATWWCLGIGQSWTWDRSLLHGLRCWSKGERSHPNTQTFHRCRYNYRLRLLKGLLQSFKLS